MAVAIPVKFVNNATPPLNENNVKGTYTDEDGTIKKCVMVANVGTENIEFMDGPNCNEAIYTDTNGKKHKVLLVADITKPEYETTVTFDVNWLQCTGSNFLNFLKSITDKYAEAKSGTFIYDESSAIWTITVDDADGAEIVVYRLYTLDLVDYGFVFLKEPQDADVAEFECTIQEKE